MIIVSSLNDGIWLSEENDVLAQSFREDEIRVQRTVVPCYYLDRCHCHLPPRRCSFSGGARCPHHRPQIIIVRTICYHSLLLLLWMLLLLSSYPLFDPVLHPTISLDAYYKMANRGHKAAIVERVGPGWTGGCMPTINDNKNPRRIE
jgi:hypothetical protein